MVHLTDQLGMADGECVKRTVHHDDGVIDATRLVTVIIEDPADEFERSVGQGWAFIVVAAMAAP